MLTFSNRSSPRCCFRSDIFVSFHTHNTSRSHTHLPKRESSEAMDEKRCAFLGEAARVLLVQAEDGNKQHGRLGDRDPAAAFHLLSFLGAHIAPVASTSSLTTSAQDVTDPGGLQCGMFDPCLSQQLCHRCGALFAMHPPRAARRHRGTTRRGALLEIRCSRCGSVCWQGLRRHQLNKKLARQQVHQGKSKRQKSHKREVAVGLLTKSATTTSTKPSGAPKPPQQQKHGPGTVQSGSVQQQQQQQRSGLHDEESRQGTEHDAKHRSVTNPAAPEQQQRGQEAKHTNHQDQKKQKKQKKQKLALQAMLSKAQNPSGQAKTGKGKGKGKRKKKGSLFSSSGPGLTLQDVLEEH